MSYKMIIGAITLVTLFLVILVYIAILRNRKLSIGTSDIIVAAGMTALLIFLFQFGFVQLKLKDLSQRGKHSRKYRIGGLWIK